nr:hypothetical protein [Tanacetum cinerariifolium]
MGDSEWSRRAGLKLARENLYYRVKEEDPITDVENTSEGQSLHASTPSRLCAQAQSVDDMTSQVRSVITNAGTRGSKPRKERFQEFTNNSSVIGRERFRFDLFRQVIDGQEYIFVPSRRHKRPHEVDAPNVKNLANLDGILRHFISLRNLSLTLTSVTGLDQVVGITVDSGPIEFKVKHLLGGVVRAMMSLGGSTVASLENVNGFLVVNTPPDDLIRIDL